MSKGYIKEDRVPSRATTIQWTPMESGSDTDNDSLGMDSEVGNEGGQLSARAGDPPILRDNVPDFELFPDSDCPGCFDGPTEFEPALSELIDWFRDNQGQLPAEPFSLGPGVRVSHPRQFYGALERDINGGPGHARARFGGLAADLRRLKTMVSRKGADGQ